MNRTFIAATTAASLSLVGGVAFAESHSSEMSEDGMSSEMTIVETAQGNEDFSTLVEAVTAADLAETLSGEGPYTVFAPTNEAFDALPDGALDELLADTEQLTEVLTYHVVPTSAMAADLSDGQELETVQGDMLTVSIDGDTVMIGDATVTMADVEASNGVIHAIDTVLMPSE